MSYSLVATLALTLAGPGLRVGVPTANAAGDAEAAHVEAVQASVQSALTNLDGVEVVSVDASLSAQCSGPECLSDIAASESATHLVRATLSASEQDYDLQLEVVDVKSGKMVASVAGSCEVCTQIEIGEMVTRTSALLREPLSELVVQPALLVVDGAPVGANVAVDGEAVGSTPYHGEVNPGAHQLVVTADAHHSHTESWTAESGQTYQSTYALEPIDEGLRSPTLRHAGWSTLGVGLAGIIGGSVALALHNRPDKSSCPDGMPDENGRCPEMYDTLGAGLGVTAAALALTGVGAALLIVDAKKRKRASVAATPRSVHFSLSF